MTSASPPSAPGPAPAAPPVALQLFGGLSLRGGSGGEISLKARKSRLLLAYLAVPPGQPHARDRLAALLWGDRQDEQARGSLRAALSGIRRALGDEALIVEDDMVRLCRDHVATDYDRLKALCDGGGTVAALDEACPGEFLAGHEFDSDAFMGWLHGVRGDCADMAIRVLETSARKAAGAGDHKAALGLMRECLSLEPLKEQTHRTIMQLYAASGERAMALAQFRSCKELLRHELGALPDAETQALADTIALNDPADAPAIRSAVALGATPAAPAPAAPAVADDPTPSVAVIPFVNMSGDAEQNYFADGITEDIITDLSRVEGLAVAAKTASQIYRGAQVPPAQISRELGVRYILEGSVRKAGEQVRISAHLTDAATNLQAWSQRYDRRLENIFDLQSEISGAIVSALKGSLAPQAGDIPARQGTTSVEAYEYYMRAKLLSQEPSREHAWQVLDLYKQAAALDPEYALAYTGMVQAEMALVNHYDGTAQTLRDALEHAETALRLQPDLAEAWAARAHARMFEDKYDLAHKDLERALELNPDLPEAHLVMGYYHLDTEGGVAEAYHSFKRAFEINGDPRYAMMFDTCLRGLGKSDERPAVGEKVLAVAKRRFSLNPHDAHAAFDISAAYDALGNLEEAKHWLRIVAAFKTEDAVLIYNLACAYSALGMIDEALGELDRALKLGCSDIKIRYMRDTDPDLDNLRKDSRFDALFAKYGHSFPPKTPGADRIE